MRNIILKNKDGVSITLGNTAPFILQKVDDDSEVEIQSFRGMNQDGFIYIDSNLNGKLIALEGSIVANNEDEMENLKKRIIMVCNPKEEITITFLDRYKKKNIMGILKKLPLLKLESNLICKFLINISCPNPYWQELNELKQYIALWKGDFSFPLQLAEQGIILGHREPSLIVNVFNSGDVPCGMRIEFKALGELTNPSLFNVNTREYIKINKAMQAGETIIITTHFANKRVELIKTEGTKENAFNYIDLESTFMQLDVGDNLFRYDADTNVNNLEVSIYYNPQYLGV